MAWSKAATAAPKKAVKRQLVNQPYGCMRPVVPLHDVDWDRLVTVDFETYWDDDYTLKKLSTSEYVRDPRFKIQMAYIKIGRKAGVVVDGKKAVKILQGINWGTHSLLCHHVQFDGFIMHEHMDIEPLMYYCTLSMARALHSNEIGAGLDEVSVLYGGKGKIKDVLGLTKGVRDWSPALFKKVTPYCARDGDESYRIFVEMMKVMPDSEVRIAHIVHRMFNVPVLKVDVTRAEKERQREIEERRQLLLSLLGTPKQVEGLKTAIAAEVAKKGGYTKVQLRDGFDTPEKILLERARKMVAGGDSFAQLLLNEGVTPPQKLSPAWRDKDEAYQLANPDKKWAYAFAKTDLDFQALQDHPKKRVRDLYETRLAVKSTIGETRAGRLIEAGKNGMSLPVYYKFYGAHTGRTSGGNKMNLQNLERGGELRKCILAPKGHNICVADSSQIEARVNAWLAGQDDVLEAFRIGTDLYSDFAEGIYGRPISKVDKTERHVGKVAVLGLGFRMGAEKFQLTLARGAMGAAPIVLDLALCKKIVNTYRQKNYKIVQWWAVCKNIIEDMAVGRTGSYKCISWEKETVWLPNGMALKYPNLRLKAADTEGGWPEYVYDRKDNVVKLYDGLLCENIVQALARIVVMNQTLEIDKFARVVMFTHDENVSVAAKRVAAKVHAKMLKTMCTPPVFMPDLPVAAEGGFAPEYSK